MNNSGNISPEEWQLIEDYLADQLNPEERMAFEGRLSRDAALQQKVAEVRLIQIGIREAMLAEQLNDYHQPQAVVTRLSSANHKKRWMIAASAAAAVIILAGILLFSGNADEKIYARYFSPDAGLATTMGSAGEYDLQRGMIDYKRGQYKEAISRWRELLAKDTGNDTLHYFTGVSFLALQQTDSAISHLKQTAGSLYSTFRTDAAWYLGLSLLKQHQREAAINYIRQSNHPKKEALLSDLNNKK